MAIHRGNWNEKLRHQEITQKYVLQEYSYNPIFLIFRNWYSSVNIVCVLLFYLQEKRLFFMILLSLSDTSFIPIICDRLFPRFLSVENNFRDLSVFDRGSVVISGRVWKLESHFSARRTIHRHFTQTLRSVMRIQTLKEENKIWKLEGTSSIHRIEFLSKISKVPSKIVSSKPHLT